MLRGSTCSRSPGTPYVEPSRRSCRADGAGCSRTIDPVPGRRHRGGRCTAPIWRMAPRLWSSPRSDAPVGRSPANSTSCGVWPGPGTAHLVGERALGLRGLAHGFAVSLDEELDYRTEAQRSCRCGDLGDTPPRGGPRRDRGLAGRGPGDGAGGGCSVSRAMAELEDYRRAASRGCRGHARGVLRRLSTLACSMPTCTAGNVLLCPDSSLCLLDFGSVGGGQQRRTASTALAAVDRADSVAAKTPSSGCSTGPSYSRTGTRREVGDHSVGYGGTVGRLERARDVRRAFSMTCATASRPR